MDPSWRRQHLAVSQGRVFPRGDQTLRSIHGPSSIATNRCQSKELEKVMSNSELEAETAAQKVEVLPEPQTHSVEPYISEDYARAERDKLWRKVWQQVGRLE